jgi:hypothetical protein
MASLRVNGREGGVAYELVRVHHATIGGNEIVQVLAVFVYKCASCVRVCCIVCFFAFLST